MSSPDSAAQLIRAVSAAEWQWRGTPPPTPASENLESANTRSFNLPTRLAVVDEAPCFAFESNEPVSCSQKYVLGPAEQSSHVGTYYPLLYLPFGLAARVAGSVPGALYSEQVISGIICAFFLLISFALTRTSRWSMAAWFVAAGPLTLYLGSSPAVDGVGVAASIVFVCVSLDFTRRSPTGTDAWVIWVIAGHGSGERKISRPTVHGL